MFFCLEFSGSFYDLDDFGKIFFHFFWALRRNLGIFNRLRIRGSMQGNRSSRSFEIILINLFGNMRKIRSDQFYDCVKHDIERPLS